MAGKGKNGEMDRNTSGSVDKNNHHAHLVNEMNQELSSLPPLSSTCSIYRAPGRLRHGNEKSYIPKVVSIGPFHHDGKELQAMEEHKRRYLDYLIHLRKVSLGDYINVIKQNEKELRDCYAEAIEFSSDEFVKIILVDAAFIIVFLLMLEFRKIRYEKDRIFGKPWMIEDIWLDMLLIENQLPFSILQDLLDHGEPLMSTTGKVDIFDLLFTFFKQLMHLEVSESKSQRIRDSKIQHFVDLLRHLYLPLNWQPRGEKLETLTTPSITELHLAGVTFKVGSGENLFGLHFKNGLLEIPKLIISEETEISIRNVLAFEQCYYEDNCVNEYVFIMNSLVNTQKDVNIMVKYGIVENRLGNNKRGSFLMNNLIDGLAVNFGDFHFASLSKELNEYYKKPWHKWMVDLKQKYFYSPWTILSLLAGATILILTFIQTVYSIKSSNPNGNRP